MEEKWIASARQAAAALCDTAKLVRGDIFVVGCSSSEIMGECIGTGSNAQVGQLVFDALCGELHSRGIFLAAQCCEHLNRALIVERAAAAQYSLEQVNVIPQPKAGGSFATAAYQGFNAPVAVESLRKNALAGMDIGGTLIGMHLHPVVVPVRLALDHIGQAGLICARTRAKFIGGSRAHYDENLL